MGVMGKTQEAAERAQAYPLRQARAPSSNEAIARTERKPAWACKNAEHDDALETSCYRQGQKKYPAEAGLELVTYGQ